MNKIINLFASFHEYFHLPSFAIIGLAFFGLFRLATTTRAIDAAMNLLFALLFLSIIVLGFMWYDVHNIKMQILKIKR